MIHLTDHQLTELAGQLPATSLTYLREMGVPDTVDFCGVQFGFDLKMSRVTGTLLQVGAEREFDRPLVVERGTGHFGMIHNLHGEFDGDFFINTSLQQFLECCVETAKLWEMEKTGQIAWEDRGAHLELQIRRIDPPALADLEGIWSVLVEELQAGVV